MFAWPGKKEIVLYNINTTVLPGFIKEYNRLS